MDGTHEVARGLVVARGNGAVLLESSKEVFNQVDTPCTSGGHSCAGACAN